MKKKGFTMVELLAVVVILGIIGTIGVVGVTKIIKSSHERHNLAQAKLFVSGAQMYFTDNKSKLPTKTFTSKEVSLEELQEQNYVEKIVDYKKDEYDSKKSYAYVTKMGTGKYAYDGELLTQEGERTKYKPETNDNGAVSFYIGNQNFTTQTAYTNAKTTKEVRVEIKDPDTIAGYIITLYKGGKELRELEYKEVGNQKEVETKITIRPEEYPDGQYRIQVKVIDIYNNQKTAKSGTLVVDTIAPQCSTKLKGTKGKNNWFISNVDTKAECRDIDEKGTTKNASGCSTTKLTTTGATTNVKNEPVGEWKVQKDGKSYLTYKVSDKAGNVTVCETAEVKKDTEKPTCQLQINAGEKTNGWYRQNADITFSKKEDKISGVKNYGLGIDSNSSNFNNMEHMTQIETKGTMWYGYVEDEAGNVGKCDTGSEVKVDTTAPNCSVNGESTTWTKDNRNITYVCNDGTSGCATPNRDTLFTTTAQVGNIDTYTVTDYAGNTNVCASRNVNVYIDKNKPIVTISGNKASSWYSAAVNGNFKLNVTLTNVGPSGASLYGKYDFDSNWSGVLYTSPSPSGTYTTQDFGGYERNNNRSYKAISGTGIESDLATEKIMIDNTPPTHVEICMCKTGQKPPSCSSAFNLKYKIYDRLSGLNNSNWAWNAQGKESPLEWTDANSYGGRTADYYGYICTAKNGGKYTYNIYDRAGNVATGSKHIGNTESCGSCNSHDS